MKITGSYDIDADRETVWKALNDPEVLKDCIPGCESLEMTGENELTAAVTAKVGPVKAKFNGSVELKDLSPPSSYRIEGSGKGGAAGFAKGGADVSLEEKDDGGTLLTYEADAQVGGKLAQVGGRLIDGTARKMADQFFARFRDHVESSSAEAARATPQEPAAPGSKVEESAAGETKTAAAATAMPPHDKDAPPSTEGAGVPAGESPVSSEADGGVRIEAAEGTQDPSIAEKRARPSADAEAKTVDESVAEKEEARGSAAAASVAPEAAHAIPPKPAPAGDERAGAAGALPVWVWFIGAVALILVLIALVS